MAKPSGLDVGLATLIGSGVVLLAGVGIVLGMLINGIVLSFLWQWFLVPLGLPALGLVHAMGVGLIVRYLTYQTVNCKKEDDEKQVWVQLVGSLVYPLFILLFGFVVHLFM